MSALIRGAGGIRVRWRDLDGRRRSKSFPDAQSAEAFRAAITDERPPVRVHAYPNLKTRIHASVDIDSAGCWLWKHRVHYKTGYAQFCVQRDGRQVSVLAHRASYETFVGPIPEGLTIDHLCTVLRCVDPQHLEPVTSAENNRRRDERKAVSA